MATLNASQIAALVRKHWITTDAKIITTAVAIALAESSGRTDAKNAANRNGTVDWGLFQINDVNWTSKDSASVRLDADANTAKAYDVYKRQGFGAWVAYKSEAYAQHLPAARAAVNGTKGEASNGATGGSVSVDPVEGSKVATGGLNLNPLDPVASALSDLQGTLMKILNSALLWIIAVVFLILGIVIVMRRQVGAAVSLAGPGKIAKVAGAVGTAATVAKGK